MKVFISYSQKNDDWVSNFSKLFKRKNISAWLDKWEITPGEPWQEAIENALRESEYIVSLLDAENINNPNFYFELGAALGMGKEIVFIIPDDLDISELPSILQDKQIIKRKSPKATFKELERKVFVE